MPTHYPVPGPDAIAAVLSDLFGRPVQVRRTAAELPEPEAPSVVAEYRVEDGAVGAACVTDLRLSNMLGAALTMVPASSVEAAERSGTIDQANFDNLGEVVNILTRVFNSPDTETLRWTQHHALPATLADDVSGLLAMPLGRRDYEVEIEEYGAGRMTVLVG